MTRRLLNLLTALSLLLCVAVVVLSVWSRWVREQFRWAAVDRDRLETSEFRITSAYGRLRVDWRRDRHHDNNFDVAVEGLQGSLTYLPVRAEVREDAALPPVPGLGWLGIGYRSTGVWPRTPRTWAVVVHNGLPFTAFAFLPACEAVRRFIRYIRASYWQNRNRCRACGYDLRATPGGCPGCGSGSNAA